MHDQTFVRRRASAMARMAMIPKERMFLDDVEA